MLIIMSTENFPWLQSCPLPFILIDCRFLSHARVRSPDFGCRCRSSKLNLIIWVYLMILEASYVHNAECCFLRPLQVIALTEELLATAKESGSAQNDAV
jgi:hypothetical protein